MTIQQSLKRLSYTVANGNKSNQTDVDALNVVLDWYNATKEERLKRNHHFCKLAMYIYNALILNFEGNNMICEKRIQEILEEPLEHSYERFKIHMDMFKLNDFFDHYEFKDTLKPYSIDKLREIYKSNKEKARDPVISKSFKDYLSTGMYNQKEINEKLNHFLSEILIRYEDKEHDLQFLIDILNK